ncbi:hypothetical protein V8C43DRAFT_270142 [Trichoderma afarasin]
MADTPGRTRSVSCEYARLSPEVTLQSGSTISEVMPSRTQYAKKQECKITHNEPHAHETRGSHWAVPNRRRTRAATGWQLLEPRPCNICHQSHTRSCVNLVGSGSHPPQHHNHGSINAG